MTTKQCVPFVLTLVLALGLPTAMAGPDYASAETRDVIRGMIEAHGGMQPWNDAKAISFDNLFFNPSYEQMSWPSPWWASHEVIDLKTRRAYHDWPLDGARLTFDGKNVWTVDWALANPPKMQSLFFFYFVGLPWLTQDPNVRLGEPGRGMLPGVDREYITVRMEFAEKPPVGKTSQDSFLLYIDPDTHRLQAYEYMMGYGAMLDLMGLPEGRLMGPMLRLHDRFVEADGLLLPAEMHTTAADGSQTFGHHVLMNHSLREKFDESRMRMPPGAVVDASSDERSGKRAAMAGH